MVKKIRLNKYFLYIVILLVALSALHLIIQYTTLKKAVYLSPETAQLTITDIQSTFSNKQGFCASEIAGKVKNTGDVAAENILLTCSPAIYPGTLSSQEALTRTTTIPRLYPDETFAFTLTVGHLCDEQPRFACEVS